MKTIFFILLLAAFGLAALPKAAADTLLQDNFDSGAFSPAKWKLVKEAVEGTTSVPDVTLVPITGSDWAVKLAGDDGDYDDGLRSAMSFPRGSNVRVTFHLFRGGNVFDTADPWLYHGIQGPWSPVNTFPPSTAGGPFSSLRYIEAGFGRSQSTTNGDISWHENINGPFVTAPIVETSFTQALAAATTKSTALLVRIRLGDASGCKTEWSTNNGTTFHTLHFTSGSQQVPVDTIGLTTGTAGPYTAGGSSVSYNKNNWIFFSSEFGITYIDDIKVENDVPPPPTPTPLPYRVIFEDDFNYPASQMAVESGKWRFVKNGAYVTTTSPDAVVTTVNGSDRAVILSGTDGDYDDGILSAQPFPRGNNLRVTFKMWKQNDVFDINNTWVYHGWNGPWSNSEVFVNGSAGGPFDSFRHIEAGISRYNANENGNTKLLWAEGTNNDFNQVMAGPAVDTAFTDALAAATTKSLAVTFRVYLGDTTGAAAEWSTDGQNFTPLKTIGGVVIDTRGEPAGSAWNYPAAGSVVSSNPSNWIFFHSEFGITWVDDLVIEDQSQGPPPAPTAARAWNLFE